MPTRWWEGHANSLLDDWFCVLGAGCEKSFKITTIRQSQVFHSVWFLISFKRGHVSHWKVRYTLNKNTLSWTSVPEIDENLSLKRNETLQKSCQFKEKLLGRRGDFDDDYPSLPCPWSPPQVKAGLLGYCTGQPSVKLRPPVLESGEQGLSSKLSLPTESCLPCGLSVLLHLQWQPMGVFLVSSHHPRTPVKTLAFQLGRQRNTAEDYTMPSAVHCG